MGVRGAGLAAAMLALTLGGCSLFASLDYPAQLPVPPSATAMIEDTAQDSDDPMTGRVQVFDAGATSVDALIAFYESAYPESEGWARTDGPDGELLCLVRVQKNYTEVVDLFVYGGSRVDPQPGRYLAMTSRFTDPGDTCGWGLRWAPGNLVPGSD